MVTIRGLDHFVDFFSDYRDDYVIVGGMASAVLLDSVGITFRATKDIDLVIITTESDAFAAKMIEYVRKGQYEISEKSEGEPRFYRFNKPKDQDFPLQIEIFHRKPDGIELFEDQHIVPISSPANDIGISAILLNDEYFNLIRNNTKLEDGKPVTTTLATIVLKAKAYSELSQRKDDGEKIDSKEIKKHRSDVFRLSQAIIEGDKIPLTGLPREDTENFLTAARADASLPDSFRGLKLNIKLEDSLNTLTSSLLDTDE